MVRYKKKCFKHSQKYRKETFFVYPFNESINHGIGRVWLCDELKKIVSLKICKFFQCFSKWPSFSERIGKTSLSEFPDDESCHFYTTIFALCLFVCLVEGVGHTCNWLMWQFSATSAVAHLINVAATWKTTTEKKGWKLLFITRVNPTKLCFYSFSNFLLLSLSACIIKKIFCVV